MTRPTIKVICNGDGPGPMVHYPNGQVEWLDSFRKYFGVLWWMVRSGSRIIIVDAKTGKETEA